VTPRHAHKHDTCVYLVGPYKSERSALRGALRGVTKDLRLVHVEEFARLTGIRIRSSIPYLCHKVEGDHGKLVHGCERVQLRCDGGEVAQAVGEGGRGRFGVFKEEIGEQVDDK
jgi:hypothetical protein